jgi:hypothetical protein
VKRREFITLIGGSASAMAMVAAIGASVAGHFCTIVVLWPDPSVKTIAP